MAYYLGICQCKVCGFGLEWVVLMSECSAVGKAEQYKRCGWMVGFGKKEELLKLIILVLKCVSFEFFQRNVPVV